MAKVKLIIVGAKGVVLALFFGYFFSRFILTSNYWFLLWTLIIGVFYLAFFLVKSMIVNSRLWALGFIVLDVVAISLFFWRQLPLVNLGILAGGTVVTILLLFVADFRGRLELQNMIKIRFHELKLTVISTALLSLTFFSLFLYILTLDFQNFMLARKPFEYVAHSSESVIRRVIPGFSTKIQFGQLLKQIISRINPQIDQAGMSDVVVTDVTQRISASTGVVINPSENTLDVLYRVMNGLLAKVPNNFRVPLAIAFGLLIFFLINGGAFLFVWLIGIVAWLIYKLILTTKFAHINLEKSLKETVSL